MTDEEAKQYMSEIVYNWHEDAHGLFRDVCESYEQHRISGCSPEAAASWALHDWDL
jgi:hypothetical protein